MTEFTNSECEGLIGQNVVLGLAGFFVDLIALMLSLPLHVRAINGSSDLKDNNSNFEIEHLQYSLS